MTNEVEIAALNDQLAFGEEYRPVQLETHVLGFPPANNGFLFERRLNYKTFDVIQQFSTGKPSLGKPPPPHRALDGKLPNRSHEVASTKGGATSGTLC